ncbi:MAG: acyl-CoA dehydrogenase family protein [Planctomycetota bacterium]|nr:acyl-CoA dehydrogenase family protein [Planctomycetota bacterium]
MSADEKPNLATEAEARDVAEAAREDGWAHPSFARELFLGRLRMDLLDPYPTDPSAGDEESEAFLKQLEDVLRTHVDGEAIDREGDLPESVLEALRSIGALGIKIPKEYGGLGLSQSAYNRAIEMVSAHCSSTATMMSGHQSIGVPQPLKMFGTEEQKQRLLPRLARGELSAFALTEPDAGSDPSNVATRAERSPDGAHWVLNGEKLWCTNGPIAKHMVVMAQTPEKEVDGRKKRQISAFIVSTDTPGVEVVHRSQFMGLRGIQNAVMRFTDVRVPAENLLWKEGHGLKLALMTLNIGRLTLPSCAVGAAKKALDIARRWAAERFQWGANIGKHDEIAGLIAQMAASVYAMQAVADLGVRWVDEGGFDIRLEAALAKLYDTELAWKVVNDCFQIRGGRGYETEDSLRGRGETPEPVERILRDLRIFTVVEGSTQVMHLFIAREALDTHVTAAGALLQPGASFGKKFKSFCKAGWFYLRWYPRLWLGWGHWPAYDQWGDLATHVRYLDRTSRRLARAIFHCMLRHRAGLERRQRLLARVVDIGAELFSMATVCARARADSKSAGDEKAIAMADLHCRAARRRVGDLFKRIRKNDDRKSYNLAQQVLMGEHAWIETGILGGPPTTQARARTTAKTSTDH